MSIKFYIPIKNESVKVSSNIFREFDGIPFYKHTLYKLKDYQVFIDTDSDQIIKEIKDDNKLKNVITIRRDNNLIGKNITINKLIEYFLEGSWRGLAENSTYINCNDVICQLHVTNPFLKIKSLLSACQYIEKKDYDSVISCNKLKSRLWKKEKYGYCPINHNPLKLEDTNSLSLIYEENSAFYVFTKDVFMKMRNRIGVNPFFYLINYPENLTIKTEKNWEECQRLFNVSE